LPGDKRAIAVSPCWTWAGLLSIGASTPKYRGKKHGSVTSVFSEQQERAITF
jgi:hypothetical protein